MVHPRIALFVPKREGVFAELRKLHHKLMVVDEQVVVSGSFSYTQPANELNDENLFVLGSVFPKAENVVVDKFACQALAGHMKAEIERIIPGSRTYVP
jgi:phosphatidylserine/phosphatidylglycerophosphate/cardiolipin synthase-like enzyme